MNYSCLALLAATIALTLPTSGSDTMIDDAAAGWIWSGMQSVDDSLLHGGGAHVGGPGSYGAYTFSGTGVDVFAKAGQAVDVDGRSHKMGSLKISIDGNVKADPRLFRTDSDDVIDAFTINGLTPGNHVLQVEPDGGWAEIDYIEVHGTPPPSGDATDPTGAGSSAGGTKKGDAPSSSGSSAGIPNGKVIALLSGANQMYVTVGPTADQPISAKGTSVTSAQLFEVQDEGDGYVVLKSVANNLYVCVNPTDYALYAARPELDKSVAAGELFHWQTNTDGSVTLRSYSNRLYVTTDMSQSLLSKKGLLDATRQDARDWEKFRISIQ